MSNIDMKAKLQAIQEAVKAKNEAIKDSPVEDEDDLKDKRINTAKVLNSTYFSGEGMGDEYFAPQRAMAVSPLVSEQYDFAMTDDPVLLNERKDTAEKLYEIYKNSPFKDLYMSKLGVMKVPRDKIFEVFHYTRNELIKVKALTAMEVVIAINEFYELNYDFVYNKILTPQMKVEILDDYYNNQGMKDRMDEEAADPLF